MKRIVLKMDSLRKWYHMADMMQRHLLCVMDTNWVMSLVIIITEV